VGKLYLKTVQTLTTLACLAFITGPNFASAQKYDLLIRGGHVIDPANGISSIRDVAISKGNIAKVAPAIDSGDARKILNAKGLVVTPGFIDTHTHVFVGTQANLFANGVNSVSADDFSFRSGVTTVVDAGTAGWRSFPLFKKQVISQSKTRILAFLNIAGEGMTGATREQDKDDMNADSTSRVILENPDIIVGVKIGHYLGKDWEPFDKALSAAVLSKTPLFVECHLPQYTLREQLARMRPGDIITHSFENISERMPIIGDDGKIRPFVTAAKNRGVLFDLGHGGAFIPILLEPICTGSA
jgi:dihydroorotase